MYHVAFSPEYSPSNALSARSESLAAAMAELLKDLAAMEIDEWFLQAVLVTMQEAVKNLEDNKTAKSSWHEMGWEDDAFSIDIFCSDDAQYVRHDGDSLLVPHGAVALVADPLHEQWLYDQAEIGDWNNVLLPKPYLSDAVVEEQPPVTDAQMQDIIANADHLQLMVVRRQYADIYSALNDDGFNVTMERVTAVVDHLATQDQFFVRLAQVAK